MNRHAHGRVKGVNLLVLTVVPSLLFLGACTGSMASTIATHSDFNGDGRADLAIGDALENVGSKVDAGGVNVIYGSALGLDSTGAQYWDQDSTGVVGSASAGDGFGTALAAGDFDGDGFADLAIGIPFKNTSGQADSGAVIVLRGSALGLSATGNQLWSQDATGIKGAAGVDDHFGAALIAGDFDGDGFEDLAIGIPGEPISGDAGAGAVAIIYGSASGLDSAGNQLWSQDSPSIGDSAEVGDAFGLSLAAGNFNGDAFIDLAIGAPLEDIGSATDAGMVHALYGSASGLTAANSQKFRQNSGGVTGTTDNGDRFGAALAVGDFNGDGDAELVIGVPGESFSGKTNAGLLHVIDGTPTGLNAFGSIVWNQNNMGGIGDTFESHDLFSAALACGDTNNDGKDDLLIGVPGEKVNGSAKAGAVHCVLGSAGGLTPTNSQLWDAISLGLGSAQPGTLAGAALAVGDFDGDGFADAVAGSPGSVVNGKAGAGDVGVLYGSMLGLTAGSFEVWDQNSSGIPDSAESADGLGASLGR